MTLCIKTSKKDGELIRKFLHDKELLEPTLKIKSIDNDLIIPLSRQLTKDELGELEELQVIHSIINYDQLENARTHPNSHLEILQEILTEDEFVLAPRSFDTIGDIVVIEIAEPLWEKKNLIGKSILDVHTSIKSVYVKTGKITGVNRIRPIEFLVGEEKTRTIYKEHGSRLVVDIAKAYFSPRLSEEHNRIATQVKSDEVIVDLFCGVGPFVIPIAKNTNATLYAIDINPEAINLLQENIKLNKLLGAVKPICGDSRVVVKEQNLTNIADRVIMNLPGYAIEFIDVACDVLKKSGGIIHFFEFVKDEHPEEIIVADLTREIQKNNREIKEILQVKRVRMSAPRQWQMVVDAFII